MQIWTDHRTIEPAAKGAVIAIGNFDGVHLGHQAILDVARQEADRIRAPLGVLTFEPHPREFFRPGAPPFRLMNAQAKAHRLEILGVDTLFQFRFDESFAARDAETFCREILAGALGAAHVVVGADFQFGKGRGGRARDLQQYGRSFGFGTTIAPLISLEGIEVSSTQIRAALTEGRPQDAARMLGHAHRIEAKVVHGEKRGRTLGYPTANMNLDGLHLPAFGVYAVDVDILDTPGPEHRAGVASLGVRPMFGANVPNLETFLFDFSGDLYGRTLSVALVAHLRGERKFDTLDALMEQMHRDSAQARGILAI